MLLGLSSAVVDSEGLTSLWRVRSMNHQSKISAARSLPSFGIAMAATALSFGLPVQVGRLGPAVAL